MPRPLTVEEVGEVDVLVGARERVQTGVRAWETREALLIR